MKLQLEKRELVALFMESPLYFELRLRDRLALLRDHARRFATRAMESGVLVLVKAEPVDDPVHVQPPLKRPPAQSGPLSPIPAKIY